MILRFLNYAVKVKDIEEAVAFHVQHLDAERETQGSFFGCNYAAVRMADVHVFFLDKAPYEDSLGLHLPPGFLHAVFEVDDFDTRVAALRRSGVAFFMGPTTVKAAFGARKIAFFEGPGGLRTEIAQTIPLDQAP